MFNYLVKIIQLFVLSGLIFMSNSISSSNGQTATAFLNSLSADQKKIVIQKFDEERSDWHFLPATMFERQGIFIRDLDDRQRALRRDRIPARAFGRPGSATARAERFRRLR